MCIPFAWANEHVKPLSSMEVDWIGKVESNYYWFYIDYGLLLVFGGIPWQVSIPLDSVRCWLIGWLSATRFVSLGILPTRAEQ